MHKVATFYTIQHTTCEYTLGTYRHKRTAATHVLADLISPKSRKLKPYALPMQLFMSIESCSILVGVANAYGKKISGVHEFQIAMNVPRSIAFFLTVEYGCLVFYSTTQARDFKFAGASVQMFTHR